MSIAQIKEMHFGYIAQSKVAVQVDGKKISSHAIRTEAAAKEVERRLEQTQLRVRLRSPSLPLQGASCSLMHKVPKMCAGKGLIPLHFQVKNVTDRETHQQPKAPFTTSTLQQDASSKLGFSPSKTMSIAQELYEGADNPEGAFPAILLPDISLSSRLTSLRLRLGQATNIPTSIHR